MVAKVHPLRLVPGGVAILLFSLKCSVVSDFDGLVGSNTGTSTADAATDAPAETSAPDAEKDAPAETSAPDAATDAPADVLCSDGTKWCGSGCVPEDDPQFGCGVGCAPCDIQDGIAKCSAGQCALAACESDFEDCDTQLDTGCEAHVLSNGDHCGGCSHECGGGDCVNGVCQPVQLVDFQRESWAIAVDATHVFWSSGGGPGWNVQRVSKGGGTPEGLAGPEDNQPGAIEDVAAEGQLVLDATHVYWANEITGLVRRMAKDGSGQETLAQGYEPFGVAVDATHVYWSNRADTNRSVVRVPKSGGAAETLAAHGAAGDPGILAIDAEFVYWTGYGDGSVWRASKALPHAPEALWNPNVSGYIAAGWGVVVDGVNVYWRAEPDLWWIPKTGAIATKLGEAQPVARFLAMLGNALFWGRKRDGVVSYEIVELSITSLAAQPTVLASKLGIVHGIAADDDYVYWTEWTSFASSPSGGVHKLRRP